MSAAPHGAAGLIWEEVVAGLDVAGSEVAGLEVAGWETVSGPPPQPAASAARRSAPDTNKTFMTSASPRSGSSGSRVSPLSPSGNAHTTAGEEQPLAILAVGPWQSPSEKRRSRAATSAERHTSSHFPRSSSARSAIGRSGLIMFARPAVPTGAARSSHSKPPRPKWFARPRPPRLWVAAKRHQASSSVAPVSHSIRGLPASSPGSLFARHRRGSVTGQTTSE